MSDRTLGRRSLLRGAVAGGAALTVPGLLSACSSEGGPGGGADPNAGVRLPEYIPADIGRTPELPGTREGVPDFYLNPATEFVEATKGKPGDGRPVQCLTFAAGPVPPPMKSNDYWQELNRRLGSELRISSVPAADYHARFAVTVSSGDLPEWFSVGRMDRLPEFLASQCEDLSEHLSGDAVAEYPLLANIPTDSWRGCVYGGGIYGLPLTRGAGSTTMNAVRTDLFERMDLDPFPRTVEDLMASAKELSDPRAGRWAFTTPPMKVIPQMYGVPNQWEAEGGRFSHMIEHPGYVEALSLGRRMVAQDMVHPDGVTAIGLKWREWFLEGSAAMSETTFLGLRSHYTDPAAPEGLKVDWMPAPTEDGSMSSMWLGQPNGGIVAVRKTSPERVRTILRIANWLCLPSTTVEGNFKSNGVKGVHHTLQGGIPVKTEKGRAELTVPLYNLAAGAFGVKSDPTQPAQQATDKRLYEQLKKRVPGGRKDPALDLYSPAFNTAGQRLNTMLLDSVHSILLGRKPVSSWSEVVRKWRREGGDTMKAEYEKAAALQE